MINCYRKPVMLTHTLGTLSPSVYNREKLLDGGDIYHIMAQVPDADGISLLSDIAESLAWMAATSQILDWSTDPVKVAQSIRNRLATQPDGRCTLVRVNDREYLVSHVVHREVMN